MPAIALMITRRIGATDLPAIGLGCMVLNHAYGTPPAEPDAAALLHRALDLGVRHLDTAALYGFGRNEEMMGRVLAPHRSRFYLASKCGMTGVDGKRVIDGRPATLAATLDASLRRLRTDQIDLYYLHRWDKRAPIEEPVGALARMVESGKIGAIGLSEVSAETLRRAHAVHPVAALQTEYSLWSREAEIAVLEECRKLGIAFVAFSPLARGFLADAPQDPERFPDNDIRRQMPRFQQPHFGANSRLREQLIALSREAGCTTAQLALAWVLARGEHVHVIPGTSSIPHLEEDLATTSLAIDTALLARAGALFDRHRVSGARYAPAAQAEIDTEEFPR